MQINYGEEQGIGLHFTFYPNLGDNSHLIVRTTLYDILPGTQTMVLNIQAVFNYKKLEAYNLQGLLLKYSKTNSLPED